MATIGPTAGCRATATPHTLRLLLVEDNALLARELHQALTEIGNVHVAATVDSEEAARRCLRQTPHPFDLLVLDVFLASGSGLGVLRAVRSLGRPQRVFVLTNFATIEVMKSSIALGADRVFDKSKQLDKFLTAVSALAHPDTTTEDGDQGVDTQWP